MKKYPIAMAAALLFCVCIPACADDDSNEPDPQGAAGSSGSAGVGGSSGSAGVDPGELAAFSPPSDPGPGGFLVTISGEDLALSGYDFEPGASKAEDPAFVDGWELSFDHVLVTVGGVRVNDGPDTDAADPTHIGGQLASVAGIFAVDLHKGGPLVGKGGPPEQAVALAAIGAPDGGGSFDSQSRYAFSFELQAATKSAQNVNLDADGLALYERAITRGWAQVMTGVARYKGPAPEAGSAFAELPTEVRFEIGFANPSSYVNCQNPDLGASGLDEDFARGIQTKASGAAIAQISIHTDHTFWRALNVEGSTLHFDQIAALAPGSGEGGAVTIDDLAAADFSAFRTKSGQSLPARSLVSDYTPPAGQLSFDPNGSSFAKNAYGAFMSYSASAQGHLNADGECYVVRHF